MRTGNAIATTVLLAALLLLVLSSGCADRQAGGQAVFAGNAPYGYRNLDGHYWWGCRFKITWPDETHLDWTPDLFLAHAVVLPPLASHLNDIAYWRFHRRAAPDAAGHQFSFLFYSTPRTAASIYTEITGNRHLLAAKNAGVVEHVGLDDVNHPDKPEIEATSDPNWSVPIQKNWPSYIMGVSALWLGLIDEYVRDYQMDDNNLGAMLRVYEEANARITESWKNEGQHAFFHHLNAIFGYSPLYIRKPMIF